MTETAKREAWRVTGYNRKTGLRLNMGVFLATDHEDAIQLASVRHGARMVKHLVLGAYPIASKSVGA